MDPLSLLGIGLILLSGIRVYAHWWNYRESKKEPEPYIPSALEDWDTDFERLTGKRVPGASYRTTGKYSGLIRGSFNTLLRPGLRKALTLPESTEEIFNEALDETVSFHPDTKSASTTPDAEW